MRPDLLLISWWHPFFAPAFGTIARLARRLGFVPAYKGLDVLLDAVIGLDPDRGYHLLVAGEFYEDRAQYRQRLTTLAARGQFTLIDRYVPDKELPLYFAAADLVMVPYLSATQSGVIQIAYAFLKPVVATTVGGIPEVVTHGKTGYLVPPGDAAAIAAAVREHSECPARTPLDGPIAAENDKYSWGRMVKTVEAAARTSAGQGR